jgi:transposase
VIDVARETNIERLRQVTLLVMRENDYLHERLCKLTARLAVAEGTEATTLQTEIELLTEQLDRRRRALYEESSEKRCGAQKPAKADKQPKPQTGHGPTLQEKLPVIEVVHELDEADKACPSCGGALGEMQGQSEDSDEIDVVERSFRILRHQRTKYRCSCCSQIETALPPAKLIAGGRYSVAFACEVAVAKYLDHAPLARQARSMHRQGLDVSTQTLWDQLWALRGHLRPTYHALHDHVLASPVIGADETTWRLMGTGKTGTGKCWVWSACSADAVVYRIDASRSAAAAAEILRDYSGTIVCDGYGAYTKLAKDRRQDPLGPPAPTLAHCWAHVRRKFVEAEPHYLRARLAVDMIGELYAVEAEAREKGITGEALLLLRCEKSKPVVEKLRAWMLAERALPSSGLGIAIGYADGIWPGLVRFLDDPLIPLDNNHTERGMRGVAIGRKNHYGSRSERGLEVAALMYTLMESAKLAGVDPAAYLREATLRAIANPGTVTLPNAMLSG